MRITRPASQRAFTLLLFGVSWVLTHVTIGLVLISRRLTEVRSTLKHLVFAAAILVVIPQLRNSMPDAPGLDGKSLCYLRKFSPHYILLTGVLIGMSHLASSQATGLTNFHQTLSDSSPK
jgi:hypothetical protein